jgi:hypothetical protein
MCDIHRRGEGGRGASGRGRGREREAGRGRGRGARGEGRGGAAAAAAQEPAQPGTGSQEPEDMSQDPARQPAGARAPGSRSQEPGARSQSQEGDVLLRLLLHRLRCALPGWDAAAERRCAQDELHYAAPARAWAWAGDDFDADRGGDGRRSGPLGSLAPRAARGDWGGGGGCARVGWSCLD